MSTLEEELKQAYRDPEGYLKKMHDKRKAEEVARHEATVEGLSTVDPAAFGLTGVSAETFKREKAIEAEMKKALFDPYAYLANRRKGA